MILLAGVASASPLVFGPKTYTITAGKPQTFSETIPFDASLNCDGRAAFILVVQNGDGTVSNGIASGAVSLNGVAVIEQNDLKPGQAPIERPIGCPEDDSPSRPDG